MPEQPSLESGYDFNEKLSKLENLLKDQYAIDFANWLLTEPFDVSFEGKNIKELLEIFKKERGL
jgi:hypothetical protein